MNIPRAISSSYKTPVIEAAWLSSVLFVLSAMILDTGETVTAFTPELGITINKLNSSFRWSKHSP